MGSTFHQVLPKTIKMRPIVAAKATNAVAKSLKRRRINDDGQFELNYKKLREIRDENIGPLRKLRFEHHKNMKLLIGGRKSKKSPRMSAQMSDMCKTEKEMLEKNKIKLFKAARAINEKNNKGMDVLNAKIKHLTYLTDTQIPNKTEYNLKPINLKRKRPDNEPTETQVVPKKLVSKGGVGVLYGGTGSFVNEPPRNQHMKARSDKPIEGNSWFSKSLMTVDKMVKSMISMPLENRFDGKQVDPLFAWKHPTSVGSVDRFNLDIDQTMQNIHMNNRSVKIGKQPLLEKHSPWERHINMADSLESGDFSTKCAKRFNSVSSKSYILPNSNTGKLFSMPGKSPYENKKVDNFALKPVRSAVSIRTNVNKKIYENYPDFLNGRNAQKQHRYPKMIE